MIFYFIIILFMIIIIYFYKKKKNNVSVLSYVDTKYNVPNVELLFLFINKYNDERYKKYIYKILDLNLTMKPVYAIKKINNNYEYEIYFYRYDQYRKSNYTIENANYLDILLADYNKTFPTTNDMNELSINLYNNKLYKYNLEYIKYKQNNNLNFDKTTEEEFIIVSYDLNENFFKDTYHTYNYYYFKHNDNKFLYYIKEEDPYGNIIETNKYNLFYLIFNYTDRDKFLIDNFESDSCVIFYAYKPKTDTHGIYFENLNFFKFLDFLTFFKYDISIINFSKKNYNNNYRFCISYDMNKNYEVQKSAIFSILQI